MPKNARKIGLWGENQYFYQKTKAMTQITFYKYQGTGNDFVMIDDRSLTFPAHQSVIARLCDRRFGVGGDGLILLQNTPNYDFKMVYFNADGRQGSMCGNGGRATVRFAADLGLITDSTTFVAVDGEHKAVACEDEIFLKMGAVSLLEQYADYDFMDTGSPHYVTFVENIDAVDVLASGRAVRYGPQFEPCGGTNVNFVQMIDQNTLYVRTYERGVEDETFSCGTGVTACALAAHLRFGTVEPVQVLTKGGNLRVSFQTRADGGFENIYLIGPAVRVFKGEIWV